MLSIQIGEENKTRLLFNRISCGSVIFKIDAQLCVEKSNF